MNNLQEINDRLKKYFGKEFRVSWSDEQFETRIVEHQGLIIYKGPKEVPKYPTIKERWILERWIPPDSSYTREIVSAAIEGSYECVYIFQDQNEEFLPLNSDVAFVISKSLAYPNTVGKKRDLSESAIEAIDQKEKEDSLIAVKEMYEELLSEDKKYPDGTRANLHTDGMKIFVP